MQRSCPPTSWTTESFEEVLRGFRWAGAATVTGEIEVSVDDRTLARVNTFTNEFWTAKQRAATASTRSPTAPASSRSCRASSSSGSPGPATSSTTRSWGAARRCSKRRCSAGVADGCDVNPLSAILLRAAARPADARRRSRARLASRLHRRGRDARRSCWSSTTRTRCGEICALRSTCWQREASGHADRRRPLDPHGGGQPAHRPLAGLLLGLHAAAEPGGLGSRAGEDQRAAQAAARRRRTSARSS